MHGTTNLKFIGLRFVPLDSLHVCSFSGSIGFLQAV